MASLILCSVFRSRAQPPSSLPPACPACLPISHPLRVCVCVYVCHNYCPPNPHPKSLFSYPPTAQHAPNPDMARFLISPFFPPGSERNRITNSAPPSPLSSTVSSPHSIRSTECVTVSALLSTTLQFRLLLTPSCKEYFPPSLFVCFYLTRSAGLPHISRLLILVIFHISLLVAA